VAEAKVRALCWSEGTEPREVYPRAIAGAVADALNESGLVTASTANIDEPDQGLGDDRLAAADVLFWWGHLRHGDLLPETVERVMRHVTERGMGFVPLHSSHYCLPFKALLGTDCGLGSWREEGEWERITVIMPDHPIAQGLPAEFTIPEAEMYDEPFDVPEPDELVFRSKFEGGEEFRSGCCWRRGKGRIFYFRPGHETYRVMYQPEVKRVLVNAAVWAAASPSS
jgi:trehalose utilization protein